jgi:hypothetical protein
MALFDELVVVGWLVSLEYFNLFMFRGLEGEFKDLVTSLETKEKPLSCADLYSHLLMHGFLHEISLQSMGSTAIIASLLPMPNTPRSALVTQR